MAVSKTQNLFKFIIFLLFLGQLMGCKKDEPAPIPIPDPTLDFRTLAVLPSIINESSGLLATNDGEIWSHNDKGGEPQLYAFDTLGLLLRTLTISNASNKDWEDLAKDQIGNIYISDSGNNDNDRQDLRIYKVGSISAGATSVSAERINFSLSDQIQFPPADNNFRFDIEALIATQDSLFLFTRDRTDPFLGQTNLYVLPQSAGNHVAQFRGSFQTASDKTGGAIRGAAISPDRSRVAILSKTDIWIFTNFTNNNFFGGEVNRINLPSDTQKEGIDFIDNCKVIISDESGNGGGNLYTANTCL